MRIASFTCVRSAVAAAFAVMTLCVGARSFAQFEPEPGVLAVRYGEPVGGFENYWWLSRNEIVYGKSRQDLDREYTRRDLVTGAERHLDDLNRLMELHEPLQVSASPDGRRVLWQSLVNLSDVYVATLEGRLLGSYSAQDRIDITAWSSDNTHFLCFTTGRGASARSNNVRVPVFDRIYEGDARVPGSFDMYEIPVDGGMSGVDYLWRGPVHMLPFLQVRGARSAVLLRGQPQDVLSGATVTFEMYDITRSAVPTIRYGVPLPKSGKLVDAVISPDGQHIAWQLQHDGSFELWIGKLSGEQPLYAGKVRIAAGATGPVAGWIDMRWLRDGDAVSFRWHRGLIVVNVGKALN